MQTAPLSGIKRLFENYNNNHFIELFGSVLH